MWALGPWNGGSSEQTFRSGHRHCGGEVNRMGDVSEIAGMVHYLCLPEANYITGQTMHINGGLYFGV